MSTEVRISVLVRHLIDGYGTSKEEAVALVRSHLEGRRTQLIHQQIDNIVCGLPGEQVEKSLQYLEKV